MIVTGCFIGYFDVNLSSLRLRVVPNENGIPHPQKKTNMALDNPAFEDAFPIEHGIFTDFPKCHVSFQPVYQTTACC